MMMYTGTSTEQDTRFSDKEKKLMKQMKFGDCLTQQVDMSKVKLDVLKPWITQKITEILQDEEELQDAVKDEWDNIPQARVVTLVSSMKDRLEATITARGGNTRF